MTPEQEAHLQRIKDKFCELADSKYRKGQAEHGGDLHLKDGLLDMAIEEALDLPIYLLTYKEQQGSIKNKFGQVLNFDLDNTIAYGVCWKPEDCLKCEPKLEIIRQINRLSLRHFVIIYTARRDELIPATLEWLRRNNIRYHAISNQKIPGLYVDSDARKPEEL